MSSISASYCSLCNYFLLKSQVSGFTRAEVPKRLRALFKLLQVMVWSCGSNPAMTGTPPSF